MCEKGVVVMSVKSLAEAIILQCIEDLWSGDYNKESIDFFRGDEFRTCAEIASISLIEQVKLLKMVKGVIDYQQSDTPLHASKPGKEGYPRGGYSPETPCFIR